MHIHRIRWTVMPPIIIHCSENEKVQYNVFLTVHLTIKFSAFKSTFLLLGVRSLQPLHQLLRRGLHSRHRELRQQGRLLQRTSQARSLLQIQSSSLHHEGPVLRDQLVSADPDWPRQHGRAGAGLHHPHPAHHPGLCCLLRLQIKVSTSGKNYFSKWVLMSPIR